MTAFFVLLLLAVFAALVAVWFISEYVIDWIVARAVALRTRRRRCNVVDIAERRRTLSRAMVSRS
jgi:hypothetical protein